MSPPVSHSSSAQIGWVCRLNKDVLAVLFLSTLFLAFFFPVVFGDKTFFFRDMLHFGYPFKHFIWKSWQEGIMPFWNPQILGGIPFFSLYHSGVFYPPSLIFLLNDFGAAFNFYFVFHHLILTFSVYRLARFWNRSPEASLGSAVTVLLGGYFLSLASLYNHFQTAVWLPLILLSFNRFLINKRQGDFVVSVIFFAIMFLAGSPETCIFIVGIIWSYAVFVVPGNSFSGNIFSRTVALAGALLLSLGISAVQLLPTGSLIKESLRSNGVSFAESSNLSMSPSALSAVVLPENHFGFMGADKTHKQYFLQSCYMGLVPIALLLAGLFSRIKIRAFWFWGALFFVGIFFSIGRFNPLYSWIYDWVPFLKLFRFPEKFFFLSAFSLVFLVGYGLDALQEKQAGKRLNLMPSLFALLTLLVILGLTSVAQPDRDWIAGLITLIVIAMLFVATSTLKKGVVAFKWIAVFLLVLDLWARNGPILPMIDKSFYEKSPELMTQLNDPNKLYRVYGGRLLDGKDIATSNQFPARKSLMASHLALKNQLRPNLGTIYGLNYADGLSGLELKFGWLWTELFIKSPPEKRIRMLQRSNVRYWIKDNSISEQSMGMKSVESFSSVLPRAFLVNVGRKGENPHLLNTYYNPIFDPLKEVLLIENARWFRSGKFSGQVERIIYGANRVRVETNQNAEGMLVLLDTYFPGWQVKVDGKSQHIFRANYFYRGVQLDAGRHVVEFSYIPEGFYTGLRISFLTLMVLVAGPLFYRFRNSL